MVMIWQLLQARHVEKTVPLILVGRMSTGLITLGEVRDALDEAAACKSWRHDNSRLRIERG